MIRRAFASPSPFVSSASCCCCNLLLSSLRFNTSGGGDNPADRRLMGLQQLPKISQIARGLPVDWRAAQKRFSRHQFLDPTRPPVAAPSRREEEVFRQAYPHEEYLKRELAKQDGIVEEEGREMSAQDAEDAARRSQQQKIRYPSSSEAAAAAAAADSRMEFASEDFEPSMEPERIPGMMPLPVNPIARPTPDNRLRVALVGSNNVGKSALWNKLCGTFDKAHLRPKSRSPQLVRDDPGLTRDAVEGIAQIFTRGVGSENNSKRNAGRGPRHEAEEDNDCIFTLVDTPGVIDGQILAETARAIRSCHAAIFVVSCDRDIGQDEYVLAKLLSSMPRLPVVSVLSKCDLARHRLTEIQGAIQDSLAVGLPVPISTLTDTGFDTLGSTLRPLVEITARARTYRDWKVEDRALAGDEAALEEIRLRNTYEKPIRVAFVGRSNSGRSSLVNSLIGTYKSRSRPGGKMTTRDTVETECVYRGKKLVLVDTAPAVRKRFRRSRPFLDQLHNMTLRAIDYADVVVVVFDAREGHPNSYDLALAHQCVDEGRPFLFAANRWDEVIDPSATAEAIDFKIKRQVNDVRYAHAVVTSSAVLKQEEGGASSSSSSSNHHIFSSSSSTTSSAPAVGLNHALLMKEAMHLHENWNRRVRSRDLTRFWRKLEKSVNIPMKTARIHRIVQSHARPPTFVLRLQCKDRESILKPAFTSLVRNALVEEFNFRGVPIRILQEVKDKYPDQVQ